MQGARSVWVSIAWRAPLCCAVLIGATTTGCTSEVSFSRDVLPIFHEHCLSCHRPGESGYETSGFSVEGYADIMQGTRYGAVVFPGYSYASTLQVLVEHKADQTINMPQGQLKLSPQQIETIGKWIDQGAKNN